MEELIEKRPKMNVSIAVNDCVDFAIKFLLKAHGISQQDLSSGAEQWMKSCGRAIPIEERGCLSGDVHMVIDEGMDSWGDVAVENGMVFLPYSEKVLWKLERYGFQRARVDHGRVAGINDPTTVVDFSGWPIVVHEKFPDDLAYHIAECWIRFAKRFPTMRSESPVDEIALHQHRSRAARFSLHPGAERYYKEKGYL